MIGLTDFSEMSSILFDQFRQISLNLTAESPLKSPAKMISAHTTETHCQNLWIKAISPWRGEPLVQILKQRCRCLNVVAFLSLCLSLTSPLDKNKLEVQGSKVQDIFSAI